VAGFISSGCSIRRPTTPLTISARFRDPSNTRRCLRKARGDGLLSWVTSHNFRKTVATALDDAGQSARQIADHVGHSQVSMTQDVYLGRKAANPEAAEVLDRLLRRADGENHG